VTRAKRGLYLLVLKLNKRQRIRAGRLPESDFRPGIYLYVGRARAGLQARLKRHLRKRKKLFWHIDYLLQKAEIKEVWIKHDSFDECLTIGEIKKNLMNSKFPQKKFGSSDCHCFSHLLYLHESKADLKALRQRLAFEKVNIHAIQA
jgi:Uri superfamily endonuclease